ncbi:MAG: TRAP transporter large permease subunit [Candidatus Handelsmanbacteria bacterium]|nr:TRAP transporter large permease subunit [Candidatus Handelsmanbacteria bacterium]
MSALLAAFLALVGAPLFVLIAALALLGFYQGGIDLQVVFIEMYRLASSPALTAIPLFAFTGFLLAESQAPRRLVHFSQVVLGWLPGGLALMALGVCALLTALTGASGMTIVALGGLLYQALRAQQYPESFSLGLLTTCGSLGLLFPPSLPLIVYGIISQTPVDLLFLAGLLPGLLLVAVLGFYCLLVGRAQHHAGPRPSGQEFLQVCWASAAELLLPLVLFSGIYGGMVAPSEAAALGAVYVFVVEVVLHREIPLRRLPGLICDTLVLVGGILIVLAAALAYTNYLVDAEVPARFLAFVQARIDSRLEFLLWLNLLLLVVGCMLDIFSALVVVVPLILPVAQAYEVHPVHLGIVFLANLEIGYSTPPVGLNLFIASLRFDRPLAELALVSLPFVVLQLLCLIVITYLPWFSLGLL